MARVSDLTRNHEDIRARVHIITWVWLMLNGRAYQSFGLPSFGQAHARAKRGPGGIFPLNFKPSQRCILGSK